MLCRPSISRSSRQQWPLQYSSTSSSSSSISVVVCHEAMRGETLASKAGSSTVSSTSSSCCGSSSSGWWWKRHEMGLDFHLSRVAAEPSTSTTAAANTKPLLLLPFLMTLKWKLLLHFLIKVSDDEALIDRRLFGGVVSTTMLEHGSSLFVCCYLLLAVMR